ncbi:MAG: transcriptional regulator [Rhizobiales bacterium]|nr:transcriptional regulator [Hyphomicrobiales bacterium]
MNKESDSLNSSNIASMIFLLIGEVQKVKDAKKIPFNALLAAPDDDTAVRIILETFASEGYLHADLHQIGNLDGEPEEEEYKAAYQAAANGEVALIFYEGGYDMSGDFKK